MSWPVVVLLLAPCTFSLLAQTTPTPRQLAEQAYQALQRKDYDEAVRWFEQALELQPENVSLRKDLAYTLLKIGETEAARDHIELVLRLSPEDYTAAMEYAYLCYETGKVAEARRTFFRLQAEAPPEIRQAAARAFQAIDQQLASGIERWKEAVAKAPGNFTAHFELARLAEQRDDLLLALEQYRAAWELRPERRDLLVDLARVARRAGKEELATAALVAAWAAPEPRTAERARELLPPRYPYVSEFRAALQLDPANSALRRELAYLLLQLGQQPEAEKEFETIVQQDPSDLLSAAQLGFLRWARNDRQGALPLLHRVLEGDDPELAAKVRAVLAGEAVPNLRPATGQPSQTGPRESQSPKLLGIRSLEKGYLQDAAKYLALAHEQDPTDFEVILRLGYLYNIQKNDREAIRWFDLARRSPDPKIAGEASRAYRNLKPQFSHVHTTLWILPFYSSRWRDTFFYGQVKAELQLGRFPLHPYVSLRLAGDARRSIGGVTPIYLSESSLVAAVGVRTEVWRGIMLWAEAGSDISYLDRRDRAGRMAPDYRGGVHVGRGWGQMLGGEAAGAFFQTAWDGVFMSRFANTFLVYGQNRLGYTTPPIRPLGELQLQPGWNINLTVDTRRQRWANFLETGPGLRFRWQAMPKSMFFTVDWLRGKYLIAPSGPAFTDLRAGVWYAFSR